MFKIEKGIPLPSKSVLPSLLKTMEIGDSVLLNRKKVTQVATIARRIGIKITQQKQDNENYRVWRIS